MTGTLNSELRMCQWETILFNPNYKHWERVCLGIGPMPWRFRLIKTFSIDNAVVVFFKFRLCDIIRHVYPYQETSTVYANYYL